MKRISYTQDLNVRSGGRIRTWFSVDKPGRICIDTWTGRETETVRMTDAEARRLIARIEAMRIENKRRGRSGA